MNTKIYIYLTKTKPEQNSGVITQSCQIISIIDGVNPVEVEKDQMFRCWLNELPQNCCGEVRVTDSLLCYDYQFSNVKLMSVSESAVERYIDSYLDNYGK